MNDHHKLCLITGANSGIGLAAAHSIARAGVPIVMVCRSRQRGENAKTRIIHSSGNTDVHLLIADLTVQQSVFDLANHIRTNFPNLNILVNNAGAMHVRHKLTVDGIERTFALNHMAYFILSNALVELLKANAPSRIINVASGVAHSGKINFDDLNGLAKYDRVNAYKQSKLANVIFTVELAKKLDGTHVTVNSVEPGNIVTNLGGVGRKLKFMAKKVLTPSKYAAMQVRSVEDAGEDIRFLALDESLANVSGHCFRGREYDEAADDLYDPTTSEKLWHVSETMARLEPLK